MFKTSMGLSAPYCKFLQNIACVASVPISGPSGPIFLSARTRTLATQAIQNIGIDTDIVSRFYESTLKFSNKCAPRYIFMKRILFLALL